VKVVFVNWNFSKTLRTVLVLLHEINFLIFFVQAKNFHPNENKIEIQV